MRDAELEKGLKDLGCVQSPKCGSLSNRKELSLELRWGSMFFWEQSLVLARVLAGLCVSKAEQFSLLATQMEASWVKCVYIFQPLWEDGGQQAEGWGSFLISWVSLLPGVLLSVPKSSSSSSSKSSPKSWGSFPENTGELKDSSQRNCSCGQRHRGD